MSTNLFALYSMRFDVDFVPGMRKNLWFVDGFVEYDDRASTDQWFHEGERMAALVSRALEMGASWALVVDPDERFELGAGSRIRRIVKRGEPAIYGFHFRELYSPFSYRIDGIYGDKNKFVLFPISEEMLFGDIPIHSPKYPKNVRLPFVHTGLNLYHLKSISRSQRLKRAALYERLDPSHRYQSIGYQYLAEEEGKRLRLIEPWRMYWPPPNPLIHYSFVENGDEERLW